MAPGGGASAAEFWADDEHCDSVGASMRVGELRPAALVEKRDPVAVPCVFAPDDSRVAWSCGNKRVLILPWNPDRNCLVRDNERDASGHLLPKTEVTISTGLHVTAMKFWLGCAGVDGGRRGSWKRNDFTRVHTLATGHPNGRIRLWAADSGALMLELCDHRGAVRDLAFAPDNSLRLVSASADKTLKAWDLKDDGNMYKTMTECRVPMLRCAWRPDGSQLVACGNSKLVYLFNMKTCQRERVLEGHCHEVTSCSFSFDGRLIISSSLDTRAIVWDAATGARLHSLGHLNPPPRLIFASGENGAWVKGAAMSRSMCQTVTVCEDGYVRFWNVLESEAEPVVSVIVPKVKEDELLTYCAFNTSGSAVVIGSREGEPELAEDSVSGPSAKCQTSSDRQPRSGSHSAMAEESSASGSSSHERSSRHLPESTGDGRDSKHACGNWRFRTSHGCVSFFTTPKHIPSLRHLARRTVRLLTSSDDIEKLQLPAFIATYLRYAPQ